MVRILLVVLIWPLAVLLAILAFEWGSETLAPPPLPDESAPPVSYPQLAENALARFRALDAAGQSALREQLATQLMPASRWLEQLSRNPPTVLCLGERHSEVARAFLAGRVLPALPIDVLMLEATAAELAAIEREVVRGAERAELLGADIAAVLRSARRANPSLTVVGIEETEAQRTARGRAGGQTSRDESIVANFWQAFREDARHVVLFGAFHCSGKGAWLYANLDVAAPELRPHMLNVLVVGQHQNGPLQAFVNFLDAIGLPREDFVLSDIERLPPPLRQWFAVLVQNLSQYQAALVFRH